jgi:hypothetical protein
MIDLEGALLRARTDKREQECSTKALPHPVRHLDRVPLDTPA